MTTFKGNIQREEDQHNTEADHRVNIRVTDGQSDRASAAKVTSARKHQLRPSEQTFSSKSSELGPPVRDMVRKINSPSGPGGEACFPQTGLTNHSGGRMPLNRITSDCRFRHSVSYPIKPQDVVSAQRRRPGVIDPRFRRLIPKPSAALTEDLRNEQSCENNSARGRISGVSHASNQNRVSGIDMGIQTQTTALSIQEECQKCDDLKLKLDLMQLDEGERTWRNVDMSDMYDLANEMKVAACTQTVNFAFPANGCRKCQTEILEIEQQLTQNRSVNLKRSLSDTTCLRSSRRSTRDLLDICSTDSFGDTSSSSSSTSNDSIESLLLANRASSDYADDMVPCDSPETRLARTETCNKLVQWEDPSPSDGPRTTQRLSRHGRDRSSHGGGRTGEKKSCRNKEGNNCIRKFYEIFGISLVVLLVIYTVCTILSIWYSELYEWMFPTPKPTRYFYFF